MSPRVAVGRREKFSAAHQLCDPLLSAEENRALFGKCVKFHQGCDDAALIERYRRAICVVLPSVYRTMYGDETMVPELLGQPLLEGMACGLPAI